MSHVHSTVARHVVFMAPEQADLTARSMPSGMCTRLGRSSTTMFVGSPHYRSPEMIEKLDTAGSLPERLKRYRDTIFASPAPTLHYRKRGADKQLCQIVDHAWPSALSSDIATCNKSCSRCSVATQRDLRRLCTSSARAGTILLSILMLMFSMRSMGVAKQNSLEAVQQWSLKSNRFAAMFAARNSGKRTEQTVSRCGR